MGLVLLFLQMQLLSLETLLPSLHIQADYISVLVAIPYSYWNKFDPYAQELCILNRLLVSVDTLSVLIYSQLPRHPPQQHLGEYQCC